MKLLRIVFNTYKQIYTIWLKKFITYVIFCKILKNAVPLSRSRRWLELYSWENDFLWVSSLQLSSLFQIVVISVSPVSEPGSVSWVPIRLIGNFQNWYQWETVREDTGRGSATLSSSGFRWSDCHFVFRARLGTLPSNTNQQHLK